jgi:hypothetical protein
MKVLNVYSEKIGRSFQEKCRMGLTEMKGDYRSVGGSTKFHRLPFRNTPSATTAIATPIGTADIDRRFNIFLLDQLYMSDQPGNGLSEGVDMLPTPDNNRCPIFAETSRTLVKRIGRELAREISSATQCVIYERTATPLADRRGRSEA